jgi:hypothetical protein
MDKKTIFKTFFLPFISLLLLLVVWKLAGFMKTSYFILPNIMNKYLPLKTSPVKDGGETLVVIDDEIGDAGMNKTYILPENPAFADVYDCADIVNCTIRAPLNVANNRIWNIDIRMLKTKPAERNPSGFDLLKGSVYIDMNGGTSGTDGNNSGTRSAGEKISFSKGFSWDYAVDFDCMHKSGNLFSNKTGKTYPVKIVYYPATSTIRLGLPLVEGITSDIEKIKQCGLIAAVGFYSPLELGGLVPVRENPDRTSSGGGKDYESESPYYDFVASGISREKGGYASVSPVVLKDYEGDGIGDRIKMNEEKLTRLSKESYETDYKPSDYERLKLAIKFYDDKNASAAENEFRKYLDSSSAANTYEAVITANKSGSTNDSNRKIKYVEDCYGYFDKAENLIKDDGDLYEYLTNIIGVSTAVPDEIFNKLGIAENGIKKIITLNIPKQEKAGYYLELIDIYRKKNKTNELKILNSELDMFLK